MLPASAHLLQRGRRGTANLLQDFSRFGGVATRVRVLQHRVRVVRDRLCKDAAAHLQLDHQADREVTLEGAQSEVIRAI